jgi:hypothetical protein
VIGKIRLSVYSFVDNKHIADDNHMVMHLEHLTKSEFMTQTVRGSSRQHPGSAGHAPREIFHGELVVRADFVVSIDFRTGDTQFQ